MQYEFLKNFPRRMKNVGLYAVLIQNSAQKMSWKQFGFSKFDEQLNLIFAVMLYIMEQSLKEENCTMDDIGAYIDTLNTRYLQKQITYEDCRKLGDFIVNVILSNEGRAMYFDGYDFGRMPIILCMSVMWRTVLFILIRRFAERPIILPMTGIILYFPPLKLKII